MKNHLHLIPREWDVQAVLLVRGHWHYPNPLDAQPHVYFYQRDNRNEHVGFTRCLNDENSYMTFEENGDLKYKFGNRKM